MKYHHQQKLETESYQFWIDAFLRISGRCKGTHKENFAYQLEGLDMDNQCINKLSLDIGTNFATKLQEASGTELRSSDFH